MKLPKVRTSKVGLGTEGQSETTLDLLSRSKAGMKRVRGMLGRAFCPLTV